MTLLKHAAFTAAMATMLFVPSFAQAQERPWGSGWRSPGWDSPMRAPAADSRHRDPREGRVDVSRFVVAGAAERLGQGPVTVQSESGDGPWVEESRRAAYEAAIVDALIGAGYETRHSGDANAQLVTLKIARRVLAPAEEKKNPVSGSAAMSVGTRGSAYGLAVNVDLSKPRPALISTRLDARITDKASGKVLWEGYASIATREGDEDWNDARIAGKLADTLFDDFPRAGSVVPADAPMG
ncbi:DUF4136 domain-containing protein [Novosphingobium malaysiense]|uniref:DUF4136 domain-containing protein n=1 Tax=Novosphingobium malaysiense TaxID=1348853 RepID=A0A0B1ZNS9_9SPHN|nr:DUF4136 domain-containing protein [Novosphingobium malaysiense]KHK90924.1 hypothetical protein LK12_08200 [Novosphingobium malaysiense]